MTKRALSLNKNSVSPWLIGLGGVALVSLIVTIIILASSANRAKQPSVHLENGRQALVDLDHELAISELASAIGDDPASAEAYYLRGTAYYGRYETAFNNQDPNADGEDFWRAITDFTKAIELDHGYADAYHYRGLTFHGLALNDHAIADYTEAILLNPDLEYPYYGRALVYEEEGRNEEAVADFERFLELSAESYWRAEAQKKLESLQASP